jgi:hypothetical protein
VLAEPGLRRAVAIFAAHSFRNFKWASALLRHGVEGVAGEALRRLLRFCTKFQDAGHPFADIAGERLVRAGVFIFQNPSAVFVLKNAAFGDGLDAAVAGRGCAGARPDVFRLGG